MSPETRSITAENAPVQLEPMQPMPRKVELTGWRAKVAGLAVATIVFAACSSGESKQVSSDENEPENPVVTEAPDATLDEMTATTMVNLALEGGDGDPDDLSEEEKTIAADYVQSGYGVDSSIEFAKTVSRTPVFSPDECIPYVVQAMADGDMDEAIAEGWINRTGSSLSINNEKFETAGEGIVSEGGPNWFYTSTSDDLMDGQQVSVQEVLDYYNDPEFVDERNQEAREKSFASFCGDANVLGSHLVMLANTPLGNTGLKFGEVNEFLAEFLVEGLLTEEAMTEKIQEAISKYVVEYPEGVDTAAEIADHFENMTEAEKNDRLEAADAHVTDAALLIAYLENFTGHLNTENVNVHASAVFLGLSEAGYPRMGYSSQTANGTEAHMINGRFVSPAGGTYVWEIGPDDVKFDCFDSQYALGTDTADNRAELLVRVEVCDVPEEPPVVVTSTTTKPPRPPRTTLQEPKDDDEVLPDDEPGGDGDEQGSGEGPGDQDPDDDGIVGGETTTTQTPATTTTSTTTTTTEGPPATEGPAPTSTTVVTIPATSTTIAPTTTLPPPTG